MKKKKERAMFVTLWLTVIMLLAIALMGGCAKPEAVTSEWDLPFVNFMTGPAAGMGLPLDWSVEFATKEINDAGGINGIPIKLVKYDSKFDPAAAVDCMSRATPHSLVILGPTANTECQASGDIAVKEGVYFISPTSDPETIRNFAPWACVLYPPYTEIHKAVVAEWLNRNPDIKSVAICYHPQIVTEKISADAGAEVLEAAGVKVSRIECTPGELDMSAPAVKALSYHPDGFFMCVFPDSMGNLIMELRNRGLTEGRRIVTGMGAMYPAFFEMGKGYIEDVYLYGLMDPAYQGTDYQKLCTEYKSKFTGELPYGAVVYYDSIYIIKQAFEACDITGNPTKLKEERIKIRDYINSLEDFRGLVHTYSIVRSATTTPVYLLQVHNDKGVLVEELDWHKYEK
jgi:branched-chain amino acid transport system substrate-binding protein